MNCMTACVANIVQIVQHNLTRTVVSHKGATLRHLRQPIASEIHSRRKVTHDFGWWRTERLHLEMAEMSNKIRKKAGNGPRSSK
jgi:hypothetical protein